MAKRTTRILIKDKLRRASTACRSVTTSLQQICEVYNEHGHENYLHALKMIEFNDMLQDMLTRFREKV